MTRRIILVVLVATFRHQSVDEVLEDLPGIQGKLAQTQSYELWPGNDHQLSVITPFDFSIGHSHSGSMDLNDASVVSSKRDVSLELSDARGSSFSSEDSCTPIIAKPRAASLDNRLLDTPNATGGQSSYPSSPRNER